MVPADVAWMIVATALVLLMTPALAFFYGGLVRSKNALNTMMMSFVSLGVLGVTWAVIGYSLAFGVGGDWIGDLSFLVLKGVGLGEAPAPSSGTIPAHPLHGLSGDVRDRHRRADLGRHRRAHALRPLHPVPGALVGVRLQPGVPLGVGADRLAVQDGRARLRRRHGRPRERGRLGVRRRHRARLAQGLRAAGNPPHNVPFVLLGAGLLWFGWFGFNAGSAIAAGSANGMFKSASLAFVTTMLAPAATLTVWSILDIARGGKATAVGAATAIVVGLVAITPAAGHVSPTSALLLGGIAAFPSYFAILYRAKTKLDDSLDVIAAHGVGGTVGALLTGVFSQKDWSGLVDGLLFGNPLRCRPRRSASAPSSSTRRS